MPKFTIGNETDIYDEPNIPRDLMKKALFGSLYGSRGLIDRIQAESRIKRSEPIYYSTYNFLQQGEAANEMWKNKPALTFNGISPTQQQLVEWLRKNKGGMVTVDLNEIEKRLLRLFTNPQNYKLDLLENGMNTNDAKFMTRYKESVPLEVVGNPDWTSANGHSVEVQEAFPNGAYRVIAPRTGNTTVLMHDELKPLTPRQVSVITTCEFGCCQAVDSTSLTAEAYAEIQKIVNRAAWDNFCNENWQQFVSDSGTQKLPFIKALRDEFGGDEIGLKDAKDAVERCVPFTDAYNKYQTFRASRFKDGEIPF